MNNKGKKYVDVISPIGRFSFLNVFALTRDLNEKEVYQSSLLLDKDVKVNQDFVRKINKLQVDLLKYEYNGKVPTGWKSCIRDGDEMNEDRIAKGKAAYDSLSNVWNIRSSCRATDKDGRSLQPQVVDGQNKLVDESCGLKSGDYGRLSLTFCTYDKGANKGVKAILKHVQFVRVGEPLGGGGKSAEATFKPCSDEELKDAGLSVWGEEPDKNEDEDEDWMA